MRRALPLLLLLAVPAAAGAGPRVEATLEQPDLPLAVGEPMAFRLRLTVTCGSPPDPRMELDVEPATGNYFDVTLAPLHWEYTAQECAASGGTFRETAEGTFAFTRAMPPFREVGLPLPAFLGDGESVWTDAAVLLRATPDADLRVGALMAAPRTVERAGGQVRQAAEWTVANHGTGAFEATVEVRSKPGWMQVSVPQRIVSGGDPATATFTMEATMPEACPAEAGVVELELVATSPEPQSRSRDAPRVQGVVPCPPRPAPGAAAPVAAAILLLAALASRRRR